jgi:2-isopropylmalate synthase
MSGNRLTIFDTTLRDGEQAPGFSLRIVEKLKMAHQLRALGVDIIEAGFPIASDADAEAVRMVATHVRGPVIAALARCTPRDIERAAWSLEPAPRRRIHVFIATSDLHLERKLRMTREECLRAAMSAVRLARRYTDDVQFSAEDATRTDSDFLWRVVEAVIQSGAKTINLPDTVGYSTPDEIRDFFQMIINRVPSSDQVTFSAHCHDDLGLATANTLSAIGAGARQIECTINGIGERAGNASLEEVVMAIRVRADRLPFATAINTQEIYPSSQLLTSLTGEGVQANKAIVGRNAFAHEAGIHQDGMLKDRRTYEIMRPEEVGVPQATLVLGKHSGRHAVQKRWHRSRLRRDSRRIRLRPRRVASDERTPRSVARRWRRARGDLCRPPCPPAGRGGFPSLLRLSDTSHRRRGASRDRRAAAG